MIVATLVALTTLSLTTHADASTIRVKAGDTVSGLADKYHTSVNSIVKWNHLKNKDVIVVGDKLNIDGKNVKKIEKKTVQQHVTTVSQQDRTDQVSQQSVQSVQQAPLQQTQSVQQQSAQNNVQSQSTTNVSGDGNSAKDSIIHDESRGQANATNGRYYGLYQMDVSRLNGDYSIANQERVAQKYMEDRYGSWEKAEQFHRANGYW